MTRHLNAGKAVPFLLWLLAVLLLLEGSLRGYFAYRFGTPFFRPGEAIYSHYPSVKQLNDTPVETLQGRYQVLLLGGSALRPEFGNIPEEMRRQLKGRLADLGPPLSILNLAEVAHSSLDSRIKLILLRPEIPIDVVVFYHGINETRANNCPDGIFRKDYSHYAFYEEVLTALRHRDDNCMVIPLAWEHAWLGFRRLIFYGRYVPQHTPRKEWLDEGAKIKTAESFAENVGAVAELAKRRGADLLLVTFTWHLPGLGGRAGLDGPELDYHTPPDRKRFPVELWGEEENVVAGIEAHNEVVRSWARNHDVAFVDLAKSFPNEGRYYDDICHLSNAGSQEFVELLTPEFMRIARRRARDARSGRHARRR